MILKSLKNRKNKKKSAFTMVELLGVMVIVGIISTIAIVSVSRYINKSREHTDEQNKNNVVMAAESFYQSNRDLLPQVIGESTSVGLSDLRKGKYLTADVYNSRNESCMENSSVRVVKLDKDYYSYFAQLYCGNEKPDGNINSGPLPSIDRFGFYDKNNASLEEDTSKLTNVRNARFSFRIRGAADDENVKIYSYSYSILVKDNSTDGLGEGGFIEVFNSGIIKGNNQHEVTIKSNQISKYVDVTGKISVKVRVYAMNDQGNYINFIGGDENDEGNSSFEDTVAPWCGDVSGDAENDDEWSNKKTYQSGNSTTDKHRGYPSIVTVLCNDENGSGCKRNDFSKSWPTKSKNELGEVDYSYGARWGYIVIEDNAVNVNDKDDCNKDKFSVRESENDELNNTVDLCHKYKNSKGETIQNGNQRVCYVRVNVDVKAPTIKAKVYKNGTDELVAEKTVSDDGPTNVDTPEETINSSDYEDTAYVDEKEQWLNLENYPNGIEIRVDVEDNLYLHRWTWETSDAYLPSSTSNSNLIESAIESGRGQENAGEKGDQSTATSGFFTKDGVNNDIVTNLTEFKANEHGTLSASITGLKLTLEGKRYGRLTVYDKAGNPSILHVYANIDRTPPDIPVMSHMKNGATTEKTVYDKNGKTSKEKLEYKASGDLYSPAKSNNYDGNTNWSRETIKTFIDGYRKDNKATKDVRYDVEVTGSGDLSGWWKFIYSYNLQNPDKPKYAWKNEQIGDGEETILFNDEGTHKVKVRSCDKAKNCSVYTDEDYLKIDYTLPSCNIKETFSGVSGCNESTTTFSSTGATTKNSCYNKYGWLKAGESVVLSHICNDPNKNISSECNGNSRLNQQTYEYTFDIDTDKAGANGFEKSKNSTSVEKLNINSEEFADEWYSPDNSIAGGHVVDYAGNVQECPVKTVKIDYIAPKCETKIEYGIDGRIDNRVKPNSSGWLSLYEGGINKTITTAQKETATVSHKCTDYKSPKNSSDVVLMYGVLSDCDPSTYKSQVYDWELRTTIAGALGIGQGGEIADYAGNVSKCPADQTINIDYTQPKCNTVIEYPQGGPINQTDVDVESGWLGFNDNKNCNKSPSSSGSGVTVSNSTNMTSTASSSNIKGEGNVKTVSHNSYLNAGVNAYANVTRADFAEMLCKALDIQPLSNPQNYSYMFKDDYKSTNKWNYILAAAQKGFFIGDENGYFNPNSNLKRAELVSAIMRAAAARGVTSSVSCNVNFADVSDDAWYASDIRAANNSCFFYGVGAVEGQYSSFYGAPTADATISEIATVIYRTFRKDDESGCKTSDKKEFDVKNLSYSPSWASDALADATTSHTCTNGVEASGIVSSDGSVNFKKYINSSSYNYNDDMLRQEFLKIVYDSANVKPSAAYKGSFTDVTQKNSYWPYIEDAYQKGYISGVGNKQFAPEKPITRGEMITVLVRLMEDNGLSTGKTCSSDIPDVAKGEWYSEYMKTAASMCLLVGDDNGLYRATERATNMEAITVVYRALRNHEGLKCTVVDNGKEVDYDNYLFTMNGVSADFWGYEYLKDASLDQKCSGSLVDPNLKNPVKGELPDTSCNKKSNEKKTAVITQVCTELTEFNSSTGQNGVASGCYGSMKFANSSVENKFQSKIYNWEIDTKKGGAVGENENGYVVDVAGNITNCDSPENWHTVKTDYSRPECRVTSTYVDSRLGKGGDYDGHWLGKNASATISSFCTNDTGGSGCWVEKDTIFVYNKEVKAENDASSMPGFKDAYTYDLAGNMSKTACEKKTVKIDQTAPKCKTEAKYTKAKSLPQNISADPKNDYSFESYMVSGWEKGWLDENYTVRVISYCEKDDDIKNTSPKTSDKSASQCKGSPDTPNGPNNQRSWNDYNATNTVINDYKGARKLNSVTNTDDFYEHQAFSVNGVRRIDFAESILQALGIKYEETSTLPFTDVASKYNKIVTAVYKNGLMIGTSSNKFSPEKSLTRAEMIVAIVRASKARGISYSNTTCDKNKIFDDYNQFTSKAWYKDYMNYAINNCILVGFGNDTIGPTEIATTQQIATVIDRALRPHEDGYTCKDSSGRDFLSQRTGSTWYYNGQVEMKYHKCTRDDKAKTDGARHTVYDNVGNYETCKDVKIQLDGVVPSCKTQSSNDNWVDGNTTITVRSGCDDTYGGKEGSGCRKNINGPKVTSPTVNFRNDSNKTRVLMESKDYTKKAGQVYNISYAGSVSENKSVTIYDGVHHKTVCPADGIVKIDDEKPLCNITHDGTINKWVRETSVNFYGNCDDKYGSGCGSLTNYTRTSKTNIRNYSSNTKATEERISYTATDAVNNKTYCEYGPYDVLLDTNAPTASCRLSGRYYADSDSGNWSDIYVYNKDDGYNGVGNVIVSQENYPSLTCKDSSYYAEASIKVCDDLGNCSNNIPCSGSIYIPGCCSYGNVGSWEDYGKEYWDGKCGYDKTIYCSQDQKKYSKLNNKISCDDRTISCGQEKCPSKPKPSPKK